jgi:hypothetical protein
MLKNIFKIVIVSLLLPFITLAVCPSLNFTNIASFNQNPVKVGDTVSFFGTTTAPTDPRQVSGILPPDSFGTLKETTKNYGVLINLDKPSGLYAAVSGCFVGSIHCSFLSNPPDNFEKYGCLIPYNPTLYGACDTTILSKYGWCCSDGCFPFSSELYCFYPTSTVVSTQFTPLAPGTYNFSYSRGGVKRDGGTDYERCFYNTTPYYLYLNVQDKYSLNPKYPSACISCNVTLGTSTVENGAVLGTEQGTIYVKGTVNLASKATPQNPIRIIYNQIIMSGGSFVLPTTDNGIKAYLIKAGKPDPYAGNAAATICSPAYESTRKTKYCGLRSICKNGVCDSSARDISP